MKSATTVITGNANHGKCRKYTNGIRCWERSQAESLKKCTVSVVVMLGIRRPPTRRRDNVPGHRPRGNAMRKWQVGEGPRYIDPSDSALLTVLGPLRAERNRNRREFQRGNIQQYAVNAHVTLSQKRILAMRRNNALFRLFPVDKSIGLSILI